MSPFPKDSLSRFVFGSAGSVILLWLLWYGLGNPLTESVDKIYFLGAVAVGGLACLLRFPGKLDAALGGLGLLGIAFMIWGLRTVEHLALVNQLWLGFGPSVTAAALLLVPFAGWMLRPTSALARPYRIGVYTLLGGVAACGALSFIQTRSSLSQPDHAGYVFNELYSVATGHYPYTDFVPQYQTLYSYLFYPLIALYGAERALTPMLLVMSLLSLATIGLGVLAGLLATRNLNRWLAPLLILPLVFLTQGPDRVLWSGSISALHSAYPVRMLVPVLVGVLLAVLPALGAQRWHPYRQLMPLGMLLGLNIFHQVDFGMAAAAATGAVLLVAEPRSSLLRTLGLYLLALVLGAAAVPLLHWLVEKPLDPSKLGWFVRQFGGGFGSEPIQIPGPVLVILPLIVGATATCIAALRAQRLALRAGTWTELGLLAQLRTDAPGKDPALAGAPAELARAASQITPSLLPLQRAAVLGSYFGVFAIAAFPYYLNRSYASGQLQIVLLPLGIALCAAAQLIAASPEWASKSHTTSVKSLTFRLALAVPVASLWLLPSASHGLERLGGNHAETSWPGAKTQSIIALGNMWTRLGTYDTIGYLGNDGNYIEALTGLHNVTRFNSPLDASMSPAAREQLCAGIARADLRYLILGDLAPNPGACTGKWTFKRTASGVVVARRDAPEPANPAAPSAPAVAANAAPSGPIADAKVATGPR